MSAIRLLATDLDGTLVGCDESRQHYASFQARLQQLRQDWRTQWAIVTGRHYAACAPTLAQFAAWGLVPDFVVLEDAHIYRCGRNGKLERFWWWNLQVSVRRRHILWQSRQWLAERRQQVLAAFPSAESLHRPGIELWFRFANDQQVQQALALLRRTAGDRDDFFLFHWRHEVCLVPSAGTKGEAVRFLTKFLQLPQADVFAIGDGCNDLSMLCPNVVGTPACVGNAVSEVLRQVQACRGYAAGHFGLAGVLEVLDRHVQAHRQPV